MRPHLEYAVSTWNPYSRSNIDLLEKVQRRATKMVKSLRNKPYDERLNELELMNLEERRIRGDLIQMFKIIRGQEKIQLVNGLNFSESLKLNLRRQNNMRLMREISKRCSQRYNFLTNRVASKWNELPQSIVSAESLNCFKSKIDREIFGMVKRKNGKTATALVELNVARR